MELDATVVGVFIAWFLREIIGSIRKNKNGVSIDQQIAYLYSREKDRAAVNKYKIEHPTDTEG